MFVGLVGATTGGATWERSNSTLYPGPGTSALDLGPAHQGPLLLNQGRDGEDGWALYFSEFAVGAEYTARTGCGRERAVLHLAAVDTDAEGWPVVNRSRGPTASLALRPPPGVVARRSTAPWSIALPEAMVIVSDHLPVDQTSRSAVSRPAQRPF
jgi:hypothetical protein